MATNAKTGTLIGYQRVSTNAQDAQLQADALRDAGCARVFEDKASGKNTDRPGLAAALDNLREGDALCVWKLDRLGRSTKDVLTIAEDLHVRGISLRILAGTLAGSYSPKGEGKFFFTMMVAFAELERDMIVERTRAGVWTLTSSPPPRLARRRGRASRPSPRRSGGPARRSVGRLPTRSDPKPNPVKAVCPLGWTAF